MSFLYALILNLMYIGSKPKISPFSIKPHISRKSSKISVPQKILDLIQNRVLSNSVYLPRGRVSQGLTVHVVPQDIFHH